MENSWASPQTYQISNLCFTKDSDRQNIRYAGETTLMTETEEEQKSLLMKVKEESESWLKTQHSKNKDHGIWSHHFMANRWGNNGNSDRIFFSFGSKITVNSDCSHEVKRHLLLRKKAMIKLGGVLKSRDIILLTKVHIVKAMVFPVVMCNCESWTIKKVEHWRIDAFQLWCWSRLLIARRSNQLVLKDINPECSLEGLMLKLML